MKSTLMPMPPRALLVALILLASPALALAAQSQPAIELTPVPGRPLAPDFDLADAGGQPHRNADYLGRPLIVNFWATWCPPCRAEMPALQRAWEALRDEGVGLIAINVGEDAETVEAFLAEHPVDFPLPLDPDMRASQRWPMRGLPTTFVVDGSGRLVYQAAGERAWDHPDLLAQVRALRSLPSADGSGAELGAQAPPSAPPADAR